MMLQVASEMTQLLTELHDAGELTDEDALDVIAEILKVHRQSAVELFGWQE